MKDFLKDDNLEIDRLHLLAKSMLQSGMVNKRVIEKLQAEEGITSYYAQQIVENIQSEKNDKQNIIKLIVMGLFTIIAGIGMYIFSFVITLTLGVGFIIVYGGLVVAGIGMLVKAYGIYKNLPSYATSK